MKPYALHQISFYDVRSPLLQFSKNINSQFGEDGIIEHVFNIIRPERKYCVEFGAWDGKYLSNCRNLIEKGWSCLFLESDKERFSQLTSNYSAEKNVKCLNRMVDFEGENSLDSILEEAGAPKDLDLVSIDIDGADFFVWEGMQNYRPKVAIVEFNPTVPNDIVFIQAKDMLVNQGCSLAALIMLGKQKDYELVCATHCNAFFVESKYYDSLGIDSNHITSMYRPATDGRIFHGYDSHVYTSGMDRFLWSGVPISDEDLQPLPKSLRVYRG